MNDDMTIGELKKLLSAQESQKEKISVLDLAEEYKSFLDINGRAKSTKKAVRVFLDKWISWCAVNQLQYIFEINRKTTREYYDFCLNSCKESSAKLQYNYCKAMFSHAVDNDYIQKNPFFFKFPNELRVHNDYWTEEYFNAVIKGIRKYCYPEVKFRRELITRLLFTTGIRSGKLIDVRKSDITFLDEDTVLINSTRKTKSKAELQTHTFYLKNKKAIKMLKEHIEKTEGERLFDKNEYHYYRYSLKSVCRRSGLKWLSPHKAKHGFITHLADKGITAEQVCALTGNTNVEIVRKTYSHFNVKSVADKTAHLLKDL